MNQKLNLAQWAEAGLAIGTMAYIVITKRFPGPGFLGLLWVVLWLLVARRIGQRHPSRLVSIGGGLIGSLVIWLVIVGSMMAIKSLSSPSPSPNPKPVSATQMDRPLIPRNPLEDQASEAALPCRLAIEEQLAYRFEWTDSWLRPRFQPPQRKPEGLYIWGEELSAENGFGAWRKVRYGCIYDPERHLVVKITIF